MRMYMKKPGKEGFDSHGHLRMLTNSVLSCTDMVRHMMVQKANKSNNASSLSHETSTKVAPSYDEQGKTDEYNVGEYILSMMEGATREPGWKDFMEKVNRENEIMNRSPFRQAPHTEESKKLKEFVTEYAIEEEDLWEKEGRYCGLANHGYIENIFPRNLRAENNPRETSENDILFGYLYKKDKKSDHVPIPAAKNKGGGGRKTAGSKRKTTKLKERRDNFIGFPAGMPFSALTWTRTFVALDLKTGMFWYCDNISNRGWAKNMKWVTPQEVRLWFSFGEYDEDHQLQPRACGFQMKSQGYKTFTFLTDSYGNQETWMEKFQQSISGKSPSSLPPRAPPTTLEHSEHAHSDGQESRGNHKSFSSKSMKKKGKNSNQQSAGGEKKASGSKIHTLWKKQDAKKHSRKV